MTKKDLIKALVGLKDDVPVILELKGSYFKLSKVDVCKTIEGDVLSDQLPEVTNKKVVILY